MLLLDFLAFIALPQGYVGARLELVPSMDLVFMSHERLFRYIINENIMLVHRI